MLAGSTFANAFANAFDCWAEDVWTLCSNTDCFTSLRGDLRPGRVHGRRPAVITNADAVQSQPHHFLRRESRQTQIEAHIHDMDSSAQTLLASTACACSSPGSRAIAIKNWPFYKSIFNSSSPPHSCCASSNLLCKCLDPRGWCESFSSCGPYEALISYAR